MRGGPPPPVLGLKVWATVSGLKAAILKDASLSKEWTEMALGLPFSELRYGPLGLIHSQTGREPERGRDGGFTGSIDRAEIFL